MKVTKITVLAVTWLAVLLFQYYSRYAAAPHMDFTTDDWGLLAQARHYSSAAEAVHQIQRDPDRPFGAGCLMLLYKIFDDRPSAFIAFSIIVYSLLLLFFLIAVYQLTQNHHVVLLAGIIFSTLPNLTESFLWPTMIGYGGGLLAYVLSALCWILFLKRQNKIYLLLSALFFAFGLGTYEVGVALPLVYVVLLPSTQRTKKLCSLVPYFLVIALYFAWRLTKGFGHAEGVLFAPRSITISISTMLWNAKEVVSWWFSENMWTCLVQGWGGFNLLPKWSWRFFFLGDVLVVFIITAWLNRAKKNQTQNTQTSPFPFLQTLVFSGAWMVLGAATSLVSWTCGRLNFIPGLGFSLFVALLLDRCRPSKWLPALSIILLLGLFANQGTARQWQESGAYQRRLFHYLTDHQQEWENDDVILLDTRSLRSRLTPGLTKIDAENSETWVYYGNATLLRGFVPKAMIEFAQPTEPRPVAVLDVECDAEIIGNELHWHERWDPAKPHVTPMNKVYVVDCLLFQQVETLRHDQIK